MPEPKLPTCDRCGCVVPPEETDSPDADAYRPAVAALVGLVTLQNAKKDRIVIQKFLNRRFK